MVVLLGFFALAGLVIALGRDSTTRYEYERNSVEAMRAQRPAAAMAGASAPPGSGPAAAGAVGQQLAQAQRTTTGMGAHPAGRRTTDPARASAWWLVDEDGGDRALEVVAGPFEDRLDAELEALVAGVVAQPVYGVQRADGTLLSRQSPLERAWLAELGAHLARLPEEWDDLLTDTDPLTTLVVEVGAALVEAGLPLHDCADLDGGPTAGGVCLTPDPGSTAVLVSWRQHDRMSVQQVRGAAADAAVQRTMNRAVGNVLAQVGFEVQTVPASGCVRVTFGTPDLGYP